MSTAASDWPLEDLDLPELASMAWDGSARAAAEIERRKEMERSRLRNRYTHFVRFGEFGRASRVGLDPEFVVTRSGGVFDPHLAEAGGSYGAAYERGVSVFPAFLHRGGWVMDGPDPRRASYHLGSRYLWDMVRLGSLATAICQEDVFLVQGTLLLVDEAAYESTPWGAEPLGFTWPALETGSDGEPVIQEPRIVTRLDPFGDKPNLPKLYCCGIPYGERWFPLLAEALGMKDRATFCDRYAVYPEEDEP